MSERYVFDKDNFKFRKQRSSFWHHVRVAVRFLLFSMVMSFLYYIVVSLFFSTDVERKIAEENRMYEEEYATLEAKERFLSEVVGEIKNRDASIYSQIFHSLPPSKDLDPDLYLRSDYENKDDRMLVENSSSRISGLVSRAGDVEEDFKRIYALLADSATVIPPMSLPLSDVSSAQISASVGERINPFYKVSVYHDGLDIISNTGEKVFATADGRVSEVVRSVRNAGNCVEIVHDGGYVTRYEHLGDIVVRRGMTVRKGDHIGYVGMSGHSFAPHLHYELYRDSLVLDPVNYFYASVSPEKYIKMTVMSVATEQSMD